MASDLGANHQDRNVPIQYGEIVPKDELAIYSIEENFKKENRRTCNSKIQNLWERYRFF